MGVGGYRQLQLATGEGGGAAFHDHDAAGIVGQQRSFDGCRASGHPQSEGTDDRVAGASDIGNFIGAMNRDLNQALRPEEIENGYILTCQSHPVSNKVVVDFDQF